MRPNSNKLRSIFSGSGYSSPWLSYGALYALAVVELLVMFRFCPGGTFTSDSHTYVAASNSIANGIIDPLRTPVYPIVIAIARLLTGISLQTSTVVIIQSVIFLFSVAVFRKIAEKLLNSEKAIFWTTTFYALWPAFGGMAMYVLTESLAMSFVIFMTWCLMRNLPGTPRTRDAIESGVWLILLIFLRPQMLCLTVVYVIFWIAIAVRNRLNCLRPLIAATAMFALLIGALTLYKAEMEQRYGVRGISTVSNVNKYYLVRAAGILSPEMASNLRLKKYIDSIQYIDVRANHSINWDEFRYVRDSCGTTDSEIQIMIGNAIHSRPAGLCKGIARQGIEASRLPLFFFPELPYTVVLYGSVQMRLWFYFVSMIAVLIWLVIRHKGLSLWLLWLTSASISGSAVIGAMDEWNRLFAPGMPEALILAAAVLVPAYQAWRRGRLQG